MANAATVIPIAGGKGGVGKTLFAANLGVALASLGFPTIVADLDLGNSNLHSLLGLPNKHAGIGDFLRAGGGKLDDFLVESGFPKLRFLPGDGRMPFMANITHAQKMRLLAGLQSLPGQYVIVDLGAGCAFHTLDFFAMVDSGIVVTTPEYPATMSALAFLKHVVLRKIEKTLSGDPALTDIVNRLYVQRMDAPQVTAAALIKAAAETQPEMAARIEKVCAAFRPRVVFNMGGHPDDLKILDAIDCSIRQILSIEVDYFGFLFADPAVRESVLGRKVLLSSHPESPAAQGITHIARRVSRFWNAPIPNSAELLRQHTWKVFQAPELLS